MLAHQLPPHESLCAHHEDLSSYLWFLIHHSYWPQILGANCPLVLSYLGNTNSNNLVIYHTLATPLEIFFLFTRLQNLSLS